MMHSDPQELFLWVAAYPQSVGYEKREKGKTMADSSAKVVEKAAKAVDKAAAKAVAGAAKVLDKGKGK